MSINLFQENLYSGITKVGDKAKITVAMLAAVFGMQQVDAQQVIKRVTDNTNETIVELFVLHNGTALPNTTGEGNFDTGISNNSGNIIVYNPALANTYTKTASNFNTPAHNNQIVGD